MYSIYTYIQSSVSRARCGRWKNTEMRLRMPAPA